MRWKRVEKGFLNELEPQRDARAMREVYLLLSCVLSIPLPEPLTGQL